MALISQLFDQRPRWCFANAHKLSNLLSFLRHAGSTPFTWEVSASNCGQLEHDQTQSLIMCWTNIFGARNDQVMLSNAKAIQMVHPVRASRCPSLPCKASNFAWAWLSSCSKTTPNAAILQQSEVGTRMYVCVCMSVYVCLRMYVCVCMSVYVCLCMYVCVCMSVYVCLCMYVCVCMSVYVCLCMYVSVCMSVYVCMYVSK